ncbi:MAG: SDR family NAD(P)-dependent oxidoreductase [Segetibacter sp.]
MKILVTGGAGFIGSNLSEMLLEDGHDVICLDNFDEFYDPIIKRKNIKLCLDSDHFYFIEGDIRNADTLKSCFERHNIDVVVHLAARAGVRPSLQQPELYYEVNVNGTLRLLEHMRKFDVKKLIFASSSSVYGNNKKVPFSENDNVDYPISPYAATKKSGELLCYNYYHLYEIDTYCLRFFTVYGPRQRPEMAIHSFAKNILNKKTITLYGDGSTLRDYTYICDIVTGIREAINCVRGFEIINLGESEKTSLIDLVQLLEVTLNLKANIKWSPSQPGDVDQTFADIGKAQKLLKYKPEFPIKEGISLFCDWLLKQKNN